MTTFEQGESLFDLVNDSVMTRTMDGIIEFWNRSAEKLYGWRKEEAVGRISHELLQTQFPKPLEEIESELVRNGLWEGWLVHTTRDGRRVAVRSRWALGLERRSGAVFEVNALSEMRTDEITTKRKQPQTLLERTVASLHPDEYFFELVNDSVMTRTMEGIIEFWNRSAEKLYGWRKEEAVGRISHELLQTQFPKPLEEIESELVRNGRWEGKLVHTTRDGGCVVLDSRWTLDLKAQSGAVVEINAPSADRRIGSEAHTDSHSVEIGRRQPVRTSKLTKADNLLSKIANIVLAGGAFFCILVLFYFIYFRGRTAALFGLALYGFFPAVLASLLFGFLQRSREFKVKAALVCVSAAVSVYAVELMLAISPSAFQPSFTFCADCSSPHMEEIVALAKKSGIDFDVRTKFEVVRDLRERGTSAVPATIPLHLLMRQPDDSFKSKIVVDGKEVLPLSGISHRATVLCNETGQHIIYESDERGFHNPKGIWSTSKMTIAAVGDSFAIGACVPADKNFVSVIRERYPDTLNLGMLGEGPLIMLAALKEYLPFLKPKVVLWFFFEENDMEELLTEGKSPLLRNYLQDDFKQGLFHRQTDIDQALVAYIEEVIKAESAKKKGNVKDNWYSLETLKTLFKLGHLRQTLGLVYGTAVQQSEQEEYGEAQLNLFRNVLLQAKESVGAWKGTLYFVYLPARDRYANKADYHRQSILAIVRDIGIPIIDVHARFQLQSDPLSLFPFGRFGHYNEEGNGLVAEEVLRSIVPKDE